MSVNLSLVAQNPELAPLWAAVHARLCSGQDPTTVVRVRVAGLSSAGIATLRSWLDTTTRRRRNRSAITVTAVGATIPLRELLDVLGLSANGLAKFVESATGRPVVDRAAVRREALTLRDGLWSHAAHMLPSLPGLVARMRAAGVGDSQDEATVRRLIDAIAAVVGLLPCDPPVSLAKLSHDTAGSPHYFDLDEITGVRLVAAVAELTSRAEPTRPDHVRALLADVGVLADRLWATVLLYQVPATGDGPIDHRLRTATAPVALTLLDLTQTPPTFGSHVLTVVENPSVLEAAMAVQSALPLACTSGHLGSVDHALLQLAVDQGLRIRYAGDIDNNGIQIADYIERTYGAEIVAMDAGTVRQAGPEPSAVVLSSLAPTLSEDLVAALRTNGQRVVFQEHDVVLRRLLHTAH